MDITLRNGIVRAVISTYGAEMQSLKREDGEIEYLWQGDPNTFAQKALNIFPYVARLTDGKYFLDGKQYEMQIHGFINDTEMDYKTEGSHKVTFLAKSTPETRKVYPREFLYELEYELVGDTVKITHRVHNEDSRTMYFGIGGHPGFNVPLDSTAKFEDYYLEFKDEAEPYRVGMSETCFVTGKDEKCPLIDKRKMPLTHDMFDEDAIILRDMSREVTLKSDTGKYSVTVSYPDMDYLGIWHWPKTEIPYVCIEPWSSLPSRQDVIEHFEEQENLVKLEAGKCYKNTWTISLR